MFFSSEDYILNCGFLINVNKIVGAEIKLRIKVALTFLIRLLNYLAVLNSVICITLQLKEGNSQL